MTRPRLLDLYCGAGGAAKGYHQAGFDIIGVDLHPQPRYPYRFIQADALAFLRGLVWKQVSRGLLAADWKTMFAAIHASPPCQAHSKLRVLWSDRDYLDLIPETRCLLIQTGLPWVIENVEGAGLPTQPTLDGGFGIELCGSMFDLGVRRHRHFQTSFPIAALPCRHETQGMVVGVYGHTGAGANRGRARANGQTNGIAEWRTAMGIDWMTVDEIAESIPPAYTEYIGTQLLEHLRLAA